MVVKVLEATYNAEINEYYFRVLCDDTKILDDGLPDPLYLCERCFDGTPHDVEGTRETLGQVRTRLRKEMKECAIDHLRNLNKSSNSRVNRQSLGLDGRTL